MHIYLSISIYLYIYIYINSVGHTCPINILQQLANGPSMSMTVWSAVHSNAARKRKWVWNRQLVWFAYYYKNTAIYLFVHDQCSKYILYCIFVIYFDIMLWDHPSATMCKLFLWNNNEYWKTWWIWYTSTDWSSRPVHSCVFVATITFRNLNVNLSHELWKDITFDFLQIHSTRWSSGGSVPLEIALEMAGFEWDRIICCVASFFQMVFGIIRK